MSFVYCLPSTIYSQPDLEKHKLGHPIQLLTPKGLFPYFIIPIVLSYLVSPIHVIASTGLTIYSRHAQGCDFFFFLSSLILFPFLILG